MNFDSDLNNFITFGCWNQKSGGVKKVLDTLKRIETDAVFISGDNYYPNKKERYDRVKGKIKKDKTIVLEDLKEGFMQLLASTIDKPVYMNFGNHDMVKNEGYKMVVKDGTPVLECAIMNEELKFNGRNTKIAMNHKIVSEHTLVLMIDTTIYCSEEEFDKEFVTCYSQLKSMPEAGLQAALQQSQREYVMSAINAFEGDNIILIGHNPIIYEKRKKGASIEQLDSGVEFTGLLLDITQTSHYTPGKHIYYLCADYHQYEEGVVTIKRGGQSIQIHQYIAGVGGTELDPYYPKKSALNKGQGDFTFHYDHVKTKTQHGLLQANYENGWNFKFIPVRIGVARHYRRKTRNARSGRNSRLALNQSHSRRGRNLTVRNVIPEVSRSSRRSRRSGSRNPTQRNIPQRSNKSQRN
jgi:hypothetical protein